MIIPNYDFAHAPDPQIIVVGAQGGRSGTQRAWLLGRVPKADVTMSVCTGASMLAQYGLLDGFDRDLASSLPKRPAEKLSGGAFVRGVRFVEHERVSTAGGLTSGIDLALHVVERYYGRSVAEGTADYLEYHGDLWKAPDYAKLAEVSPDK